MSGHARRYGVIIGLSLLAGACGRKGPLIYPDMLIPAAPTAATAQQSGSAVRLQFGIPDKDMAGRPVEQGIAGVTINRRVNEPAQGEVCRTCLTDYRLFQTIYLDHVPTATQRFGNSLIVVDNDVIAGKIYSYAIASFTADGVVGSSSQTSDVHMDNPPPAPVLKVAAFPTELKLQFSSQPVSKGRLAGYNLYRSPVAAVRSYKPLNGEPLKSKEYVDSNLERGVTYRYSATTVIMTSSGEVVESYESPEVEGMLKDDE
jgi:predicted small lipoprotein YifL